jgi:hypothetical protein
MITKFVTLVSIAVFLGFAGASITLQQQPAKAITDPVPSPQAKTQQFKTQPLTLVQLAQ